MALTRRFVLIGAPAALIAAGCGAGSSPGASDTPPRPAATTPSRQASATSTTWSQGDFSVAAALSQLPTASTTHHTQVDVGDVAAATRMAGVPRPEHTATSEQARAWSQALTGHIVVAWPNLLPAHALLMDRAGKAVGFTVADVTRFAGWRTQGRSLAVSSLVDGARLRADLPAADGITQSADGALGSLASAGGLPGGPYPAVTGFVARQGGRDVAASLDAPTLTTWGSNDGFGPSLAEQAAWNAVAQALDSHSVYGARLVSPHPAPGSRPGATALKTPYDVAGIGWTMVGQRSRVFVVYHYPGGATADEEKQVRAAWQGRSNQTRRRIDDVSAASSVERADNLISVTLDPLRSPTDILAMQQRADLPFALPQAP